MRIDKKHITFICFLLLGTSLFAQQTKDLGGRVYSKDGDVAGTHVINSTTQRATIADAKGFFSIPVSLYDTLVFSAVQYKRKMIPVNLGILESNFLNVYLEAGEIKLDEVLVMPYNLSGDLTKDLDSLKIGPIITASSLGLPNADVIVKTQSERKLFEADNGKFLILSYDTLTYKPELIINLNKILNRISGRTQMLKRRISVEEKDKSINELLQQYRESLLTKEFKIPKYKIADFKYFCEVDSSFQSILESRDRLKLWEYLRDKSIIYRENNGLED